MGPTVRVENGPFERAVFGGGIQGRPDLRHQVASPARLSDWLLVGYGSVYSKAHRHQGRIEAFSRGCFADSVSSSHSVSFLRDHTWSQHLGSTADGRLELFEDDIGLAFALRPG